MWMIFQNKRKIMNNFPRYMREVEPFLKRFVKFCPVVICTSYTKDRNRVKNISINVKTDIPGPIYSKILCVASTAAGKAITKHKKIRHSACVCFENIHCCKRLFRFPRYAQKRKCFVCPLTYTTGFSCLLVYFSSFFP